MKWCLIGLIIWAVVVTLIVRAFHVLTDGEED